MRERKDAWTHGQLDFLAAECRRLEPGTNAKAAARAIAPRLPGYPRNEMAVYYRIRGDNLIPPMPKDFWTKEQEETLRQELEKLVSLKRIKKWTSRQMEEMLAEKLNRTVSAIQGKADTMKLSFGDRADLWTDEEVEQLIEDVRWLAARGGLIRDISVQLAKKMRHNAEAIQSKISKLGILPQPRRYGTWTEEEKEYLIAAAGERPFADVWHNHCRWRKSKGLKPRSRDALRRFYSANGISVKVVSDMMYTVTQIADGLRCPKSKIHRWLESEQQRKVLEPQGESSALYIRTKNLRRFLIKYPTSIEGTQPDMLWLIELLTDESVD